MGNLKNRLSQRTIGLVLMAIFLTSTISFAGGGWPQPKGKGYFKISEWWVVADQHYTLMGGLDPNTTAGLYNTTFYGEYGITDQLTLIGNIPLLSRSVINNVRSLTTGNIITPGDQINAPGDIDISLKYGLFQYQSISLSGTVTFGIPTGVTNGGIENNLQTGDGELNQIFRLDAGIPLLSNENFSSYSNLYFGFNNRTGGFSNEHRYGAEVGVGIIDSKLWLTGRFDVIKSRENESFGTIEGSFFANNTEVTSLTAEISYQCWKNAGVSVSYGTAIDGKIVYAAPSYSVGVFLKL